jgi:Fungal specific transcription factor domain
VWLTDFVFSDNSAVGPSHIPVFRCGVWNPLGTWWLQAAVQDPVLMHATLYDAGTHLDVLSKRPMTPATLKHKVETIRLVNQRISYSSSGVSPSLIAAVLALGTNEVSDLPQLSYRPTAAY